MLLLRLKDILRIYIIYCIYLKDFLSFSVSLFKQLKPVCLVRLPSMCLQVLEINLKP